MPLEHFHPAVSAWFATAFPEPTAPQVNAWPAIKAGGQFCANVLADGQESIARQFAASGGDKFAGVSWTPAPATGAPLLDGIAAWIDCRIYESYEAGDHWLVLGEVLELSIHREGGALVFHSGAFRPLA